MSLDDYLNSIESEMNANKKSLDEYLNQLRPQSNREYNKFCPYCGHDLEPGMTFCPYCGSELDVSSEPQCAPQSDTCSPVEQAPEPEVQETSAQQTHCLSLPHYEELEEDSKAKIGTFERLYNSGVYAIAKSDFSTQDYSPLVTPLAGMIEVELSLSIYQAVRQIHGVEMPKFFNRDCKGATVVKRNNLEIDFAKGCATMGTTKIVAQMFKEKLRPILPEIDDVISALDAMKEKRNDSAHGVYVSEQDYRSFFQAFQLVYCNYMPCILSIKQYLKQCSDGQQKSTTSYKEEAPQAYLNSIAGVFSDSDASQHTPSASSSTSNNQSQYTVKPAESLFHWEDGERPRGIIFTDSGALAKKTFGKIVDDNNNFSKLIYEKVFDPVIDVYRRMGVDYVVLDMFDSQYAKFIAEDKSWKQYHMALDAFCKVNGIGDNAQYGLFIIGGMDVIPMATIKNPRVSDEQRERGIEALEQDLDTDTPYAYPCDRVVLKKGFLSFDTLLKDDDIRFHVGRLPLETGMLKTHVVDDLVTYFNKLFQHGYGTPVKNVLYAAAELFYASAKGETNGLPLITNMTKEGVVYDGLFCSPGFDLADENSENNADYNKLLPDADILMFDTHSGPGNNEMGASFTGESSDRKRKGQIAFCPSKFHDTNARILAATCCYGARFNGYERPLSALLTAMYESNVITFFGSTRSAYGSYVDGVLGGIESGIFYFVHYLLQGLPAGMAWNKSRYDLMYNIAAKCDIAIDMMTFLEFNVFGDPLMCYAPIEERQDLGTLGIMSKGLGHSVDKCQRLANVRHYKMEQDFTHQSLLDRVRNITNSNLRQIHDKVNELLYSNYHVEPRSLQCIESYTTDSGDKGYSMTYHTKGDYFDQTVLVDTDQEGRIQNIYFSK